MFIADMTEFMRKNPTARHNELERMQREYDDAGIRLARHLVAQVAVFVSEQHPTAATVTFVPAPDLNHVQILRVLDAQGCVLVDTDRAGRHDSGAIYAAEVLLEQAAQAGYEFSELANGQLWVNLIKGY